MGWMASWVAVRGVAKGELLAALNFVETGEVVEPGSRAAPMSCGVLPDGWVVLFSEHFDWGDQRRVLEFSRFGPTVGCQFEDKVEMTSIASGAEKGVEVWRVAHINDPKYRLDVSGEPPAQFAAIRDRFFREQDEDGGAASSVDFVHEIPLELAKSVCGYRADEDDKTVFIALGPVDAGVRAQSPSRMTLVDKLLAPFRRPAATHPWRRRD